MLAGKNPVIKFTNNWANKLNCFSFTTIRMSNQKYYKGAIFDVELKGVLIGTVTLIDVETIRFVDITPRVSFVDVGRNPFYLKELLTRMYQKLVYPVTMEQVQFALMTCTWMGPVPTIAQVPKQPKTEEERRSKMYPVAEP